MPHYVCIILFPCKLIFLLLFKHSGDLNSRLIQHLVPGPLSCTQRICYSGHNTALYYSKLYYGAEIWHIPGLSLALNKNIKFASANAAKLYLSGPNLHLATHTEIHQRANTAKRVAMILYRHAIIAFRLFRDILCEYEFVHLNFQLVDNARATKH